MQSLIETWSFKFLEILAFGGYLEEQTFKYVKGQK